jgi:sigma-54 dependent transcriptional regulator, acetoin dehydrogenase operon transcriptional activator AcoR
MSSVAVRSARDPRNASAAPVPADDEQLARSREQFLTFESAEPGHVRDSILASWWRSRRWNVAADRIDLSYKGDPRLDTPLTRSAVPVLHHLREHLDGQPISIILTDASGLVLVRLVAEHDLDRHLESVQLSPGFSYAEEAVGTNGIGTALEAGKPMHVFGHEHYAEHLENLACAAVPIHHPISGTVMGAVDLTCWRRDADALLVTLVKTTADQISQALLTDSNAREFELLQEYLRMCRHSTGLVLALNHDVTMMNDYARQVLDPADQALVLGRAGEILASRRTGPVAVDLPTGGTALLYCRPLRPDDTLAGGVVQVKLAESPRRLPARAADKAGMIMPGLVGSGPLWVRACHQVEAVYDSGEWLALEGEPGAGKLAVVRAVHQRRDPAGHFRVLDAAEAVDGPWLARARDELLGGYGCLVIRHVDRLTARQLHVLSGALQEARAADRTGELWVAVTLSRRRANADLTKLLRFFPSTVEIPPLRHHIEDVHELIPFFLGRLSQHGRVSCSPDAMQLLQRGSWPGNIEQLWAVLKWVVHRRRTGAMQPGDLPPECWAVSRRLLSPLESIERDAIVQSLQDCKGSKVHAAKSLGMSRATIYRKIRDYGIVVAVG